MYRELDQLGEFVGGHWDLKSQQNRINKRI